MIPLLKDMSNGYDSGYKRGRRVSFLGFSTFVPYCAGVTYTNTQVREDPGFSLQSAGFMRSERHFGFG
jgi:hypothetical protein